MTHRDRLGSFILPTHLMDAIRNYVPPALVQTPEYTVDPTTGGVWIEIKTFKSTKGSSIHTVSRRGDELKCTCQGFRIQKKGSCKHTTLVAQELGL